MQHSNYSFMPSEKASIVAVDVSNDPTFPRTKKQCPECSWEEAVFFQSNKRADTSMKVSLFKISLILILFSCSLLVVIHNAIIDGSIINLHHIYIHIYNRHIYI